MMASRQLLGATARSRAIGSVSKGLRCMATATDSPLDRKVSVVEGAHPALSAALGSMANRAMNTGPPEHLGGEQLHQLQEDVGEPRHCARQT